MVVGVWLAYFSKQEILKTQLITASEDTHQGHHHGHAHDTGSEKRNGSIKYGICCNTVLMNSSILVGI